MKQTKPPFIIAITNLLLSAYYLLVGFRLSALYSEFNAEAPNPVFNKYFLGFLILAVLGFAFWAYLKKRLKKGLEINKKLYYVVLLSLSIPAVYLAFQLVYSLIVIDIVIPLTI